jgi:hypothetical protein
MKKKSDEGLLDQFEKPVSITNKLFSLKMPAVVFIFLIFLFGIGFMVWVSDFTILGCHKPSLPVPGLHR